MKKISTIINLVQKDFIDDMKRDEELDEVFEIYGHEWFLTTENDSFTLGNHTNNTCKLKIRGNLDFDPDPKISVTQVTYGDILIDEV